MLFLKANSMHPLKCVVQHAATDVSFRPSTPYIIIQFVSQASLVIDRVE